MVIRTLPTISLEEGRRDSLREIGEAFQIGKYSTISSVIQRAKDEIQKERSARKSIEELTS